MKITDAVHALWTTGFFEKDKQTNEVKLALQEKYGMNPSNISETLRTRKFLRRPKSGWLQRKRFGLSKSKKSEEELHYHIEDSRLQNACKTNFDAGNYWDAVFNGLRHLEVRVRKHAKLTAADVGVDLMEKAFKPRAGKLAVPACETSGEQDGFKQIMKGLMLFHRNAKGHREEEIDKCDALKILGYIDYLLAIVGSSKRRND